MTDWTKRLVRLDKRVPGFSFESRIVLSQVELATVSIFPHPTTPFPSLTPKTRRQSSTRAMRRKFGQSEFSRQFVR